MTIARVSPASSCAVQQCYTWPPSDSVSSRKPSETRARSPSHATSSPRKPEQDRELTQCAPYRENDRGLTTNSTTGGKDHDGVCVDDYLCFHHS